MAKKKIDGVTYDIMEGVRVNEYGAAFKILQGKYGEDVCFNTLEPAVVETYKVTFDSITSLERDHSSGWTQSGNTFAAVLKSTNDTQYIEFGCDTNFLPDGARIQSVSIDFRVGYKTISDWELIDTRGTYTYNNQIQNLNFYSLEKEYRTSTSIDMNGMSKDTFSRNRFRFEYDDYRDTTTNMANVQINMMKFVVTYTREG